MWFLILLFGIIPVMLIGWWLKLLHSNRNVPNPPSFGKPLCCNDNDFLAKVNKDWHNEFNRRTHGYYD